VNRDIRVFARPFYFLRHGETVTNAAGLLTGSLDVQLTPHGREQAANAAERLAKEPITGIYVSPMERARHTADPVAARLNVPLHVLDDLAERGWGVLEGRPRAARRRGITPEGAETLETFTARVLTAFARMDEPVPLVVAHSGVFRVLCHTLGIRESETPVTNALPLRFVPVGANEWRIEET
jgi:probable phosphoglycerate mutase